MRTGASGAALAPRIFAFWPTGDDDYLAFAEQYGLLGARWQEQVWPLKYPSRAQRPRERSRPPALQRRLLVGERIQRWTFEQRLLRDVVERWDSVQSGKLTAEGRHQALTHIQRLTDAALRSEGVMPMLLWQRGVDRLGLHFVPRSLLGAMWLQFARAVAGNKQYRQCSECGRWWEVSAEVTRSDRDTCSNACKQRRYRRNKREKKAAAAATTHAEDTP